MADAEVIIAGAGPAGLMAAYTLARKGRRVLVIERRARDNLGRQLRISLEERTFLEVELEAPVAPERLSSPLARELISPDNRYKVRVTDAALVSVDLRLLTERLRGLAEAAGARFLFETTLTGPLLEDGRAVGVVGTTADGRLLELRAPLSVDATGIAAVLRHGLDPNMGVEIEINPEDVINAWQESREIDRDMVRDLMAKNRVRPQVNVCRVGFMGPHSMFSVFLNLEDDRVDITVGLPHSAKYPTARELVESYIESHRWVGEPISGGGGLIPVRYPLDSFVADGLALVGDSACQTIPAHASGVASALYGGRMLGECADDALQDGANRESLWPYNVRYMRMRGAAQANSELYRLMLNKLGPDNLASLFNCGLITEEGAKGSLEALPLELPRAAVIQAGAKLFRSPRLLARLYRLSREVHRVLDLYMSYPGSPDERQFHAWRKKVKKLFDKWR